MIVTKVYVLASGGEELPGQPPPPPPQQEVADLCARMRSSSSNWAYRTDIRELDLAVLFAIAQAKYSIARGLPAGFLLDWGGGWVHSVNPSNPNQWIRNSTRAGWRFRVTATGRAESFVLVAFEPEMGDGGAPVWEEAPVLP